MSEVQQHPRDTLSQKNKKKGLYDQACPDSLSGLIKGSIDIINRPSKAAKYSHEALSKGDGEGSCMSIAVS